MVDNENNYCIYINSAYILKCGLPGLQPIPKATNQSTTATNTHKDKATIKKPKIKKKLGKCKRKS